MQVATNVSKSWSLRAAVLLAAANAVYAFLPALKETMDPQTWVYANMVGGAVIAALRVVKQGNMAEPPTVDFVDTQPGDLDETK